MADILFSQGFGTRRECAVRVLSGAVTVGGQVQDDPARPWPVAGLRFSVDGVEWPFHATALVLLHKPAGYECSQRPRHHPSVLSLLPEPLRRRGVQPVGRLDADTTGLLLLTDDGALIHRLTSPKHHEPKVYEVTARHPVDAGQIERLLAGVVLDDDPRPVRAAAAVRTDAHNLSLTLTEGKYHQVKRMLAAVGNRVEALHRSAFGPWTLDATLPPGQWRWLSADQVS
ncbi:MAG: pseudouridine synthase [Burkholderiales bacterium]|nr:pseudouridine synthase [Burkholderiales bacterium]MDE2275106.1 pseudouridine synthase [Burkholderiales bacterium]